MVLYVLLLVIVVCVAGLAIRPARAALLKRGRLRRELEIQARERAEQQQAERDEQEARRLWQ